VYFGCTKKRRYTFPPCVYLVWRADLRQNLGTHLWIIYEEVLTFEEDDFETQRFPAGAKRLAPGRKAQEESRVEFFPDKIWFHCASIYVQGLNGAKVVTSFSSTQIRPGGRTETTWSTTSHGMSCTFCAVPTSVAACGKRIAAMNTLARPLATMGQVAATVPWSP